MKSFVLLGAVLALAAHMAPGNAHADDLMSTPQVGAISLPASLMSEKIERLTSFAYEYVRPEKADGRTIVLLHGSGGDEKTLLSLARKVAPEATLLGVRGRVKQEGVNRWYRRLSPTSFDQQDVRAEASAFVDFLKETSRQLGLDMEKAIFLGYSNGANLIAAMSMLHPGEVHRAVLLRAMPVLDNVPDGKLSSMEYLTIAGRNDATYGPYAPALEEQFRKRGATVDSRIIDTGHLIADEDERIIREWLLAAKSN